MSRPIVDLTRSGVQEWTMSIMVSIRKITKSGTHNLTPIGILSSTKLAVMLCNALNREEAGGKDESLALTTSRRRVSK